MDNGNDLNLHSMTKLSGWLRYCTRQYMKYFISKINYNRFNYEHKNVNFVQKPRLQVIAHLIFRADAREAVYFYHPHAMRS